MIKRYLLMIPGILLLDIPLMLGFMYLDTWLLTPEPGKTGHPMPFISMLGFMFLVALTIVVIITALYLSAREYYRQKKNTET